MNYQARFRAETARGNTLSQRVWDTQQECVRLAFSRSGDKTAKWVAQQLIDALAEFEGAVGWWCPTHGRVEHPHPATLMSAEKACPICSEQLSKGPA